MKPQKVETNNGNQGFLDRKNIYVEKVFLHVLYIFSISCGCCLRKNHRRSREIMDIKDFFVKFCFLSCELMNNT